MDFQLDFWSFDFWKRRSGTGVVKRAFRMMSLPSSSIGNLDLEMAQSLKSACYTDCIGNAVRVIRALFCFSVFDQVSTTIGMQE